MKNLLPQIVALLPIDDVFFPGVKNTIEITCSPKTANFLRYVFENERWIGLVLVVKDAFRRKGVLGKIGDFCGPSFLKEEIERIILKGSTAKLLIGANLPFFVECFYRFQILEIIQTHPFYLAKIQILVDQITDSPENLKEKSEKIKILYQQLHTLTELPDENALQNILESEDPAFIVDQVAYNLPRWLLKIEEKQEILETIDLKERLEKLARFLHKIVLLTKTKQRILKELGDGEKEIIIREQIKILEDELKKMGKTRENPEVVKYREKAQESSLPPHAQKEFEEELDRFAQAHPQDPTNQYRRAWLDLVVSLPWNKSTEDRKDLREAEKILEEDHYGLEEVKRRIIEFLAVKQLNPKSKGSILCFIGPPGTGKTSVGKSIARALGRKFTRISLGGAKDERQIRGFEKTYVGAIPGIIIQELKRLGVNNPVFMIDEIDKVGAEWRGDPTSALLEVLDPEQNHSFRDHYLGIPFDLSKIFFICTGNVAYSIQPALRDRMEIIEFPGYTSEEKLIIAKKFLIPKVLEANGLKTDHVLFRDEAIKQIIKNYTLEAGVRNLERMIEKCIRKVAISVVKGKNRREIITGKKLIKFLGPPYYLPTLKEKINRPGIAIGLAWTPYGGKLIFIETEVIGSSQRQLEITGNVEKIMAESIKIALTYLEANASTFKIPKNLISGKTKIHVHIPEAAIPKDGPSAGLAILISLISFLTQRKVKEDVAISGEITLRGKILPVGGINEKLLAAKENGIKTVILPIGNKKDEIAFYKSIKEALKRGDLQIIYLSDIKEAIEIALDNPSN